MEIQQQTHGAVAVFKPQGPVTQADADGLRMKLLSARTTHLGRFVLDVSAVAYVDGGSLEALLDVTEELEKNGQVLKLCGANDVFREVLELTGLATAFEHFDDVNSAVRSFL